MYAIVAVSCRDCDYQAIQLLETKPTKEDKEKLSDGYGCARIFEVEINVGEIKELDYE